MLGLTWLPLRVIWLPGKNNMLSTLKLYVFRIKITHFSQIDSDSITSKHSNIRGKLK